MPTSSSRRSTAEAVSPRGLSPEKEWASDFLRRAEGSGGLPVGEAGHDAQRRKDARWGYRPRGICARIHITSCPMPFFAGHAAGIPHHPWPRGRAWPDDLGTASCGGVFQLPCRTASERRRGCWLSSFMSKRCACLQTVRGVVTEPLLSGHFPGPKQRLAIQSRVGGDDAVSVGPDRSCMGPFPRHGPVFLAEAPLPG